MTRCDWCKKRRKTEGVSVVMSETASGYPIQNHWAREWELCRVCRTACKRELNNWDCNMQDEYRPDDQPE